MHYMNLGFGIFMIFMGWLCYRYPKLINPYGGMPPERQALVDIDSLKKALALTMGVDGLLLIVLFALGISGLISIVSAGYLMPIIMLAMLPFFFIFMRRYNGYGRDASGGSYFGHRLDNTSKWTLVILGLTVVVVVILLVVSSKPASISLGDKSFKTSGGYGIEVRYDEIVSMEILEKMPAMQMRINGSSTAGVSKGWFLTKEGEKCLLFVSYNGGPYIELRTADQLVYMNCASREKTLEVVSRLQEAVGQSETSGW